MSKAGKNAFKNKRRKAAIAKNRRNQTHKPLVKEVDLSLELPLVVYKITIKEFIDMCASFHEEFIGGKYEPVISIPQGNDSTFSSVHISFPPIKLFEAMGTTPEKMGPELAARLLTVFREFEDQTIIAPITDDGDEDGVAEATALTSQPYDEKELYALFFLYDETRYRYIKIKIAASTIKKAGMGVFTMEDIPIYAVGQYKGVPREEANANMYYSWAVRGFDPVEGDPNSDVYMYYIDAQDFETSNWTRYVNCGMSNAENNMDQEQVYDKIFYTTTRAVKAGSELFVDYGEDYRVYNFGMGAEDY